MHLTSNTVYITWRHWYLMHWLLCNKLLIITKDLASYNLLPSNSESDGHSRIGNKLLFFFFALLLLWILWSSAAGSSTSVDIFSVRGDVLFLLATRARLIDSVSSSTRELHYNSTCHPGEHHVILIAGHKSEVSKILYGKKY